VAKGHTHWPEEAALACRFRTKKECDENYANWQAEQQVLLAEAVVRGDHGLSWKRHKQGNSVFDQLVLVIAGERPTITNGDGVESQAPFTRRVLAALARRKKE
jgi:hypothetical protein